MKVFRRTDGYTLCDHKGMKKFGKSWKQNQLTRN